MAREYYSQCEIKKLIIKDLISQGYTRQQISEISFEEDYNNHYEGNTFKGYKIGIPDAERSENMSDV